MITVAVTGGIGAGKSTASAALRDRGAVLIDSDQLAREVVAPGSPGIAAIAESFGPAMIGRDGALDRAALAAVVFADSSARSTLEGITHPLVRARFAELQRTAPPDAVVVNDIPLLTTIAVAAGFHLLVGVQADAEVRVQRLIRRGLAEPDARARMAAQLTDEQRAELCDVVLTNNGGPTDLGAAVDALWEQRLLPFEENTRTGRRAPRGGPELVDPRESWAVDGRRLAARVSAAAGGARVDHVGSTSIPGMPAKDVIDLQLTVPDLASVDEMSEPLRLAGFPELAGFDRDTPHPADDDPARWRKRLHVNADPGQSVNLHLRVRANPNWHWALLFRDWLRSDRDAAADYLTVKRSLVARFGGDATAERYAAAKEPFFDSAHQRGWEWAARTGWSPDDSGGSVAGA